MRLTIIELIVGNKTILNVLKLTSSRLDHAFSVKDFCKLCIKYLQIYFHPRMTWSKKIFVLLRVETQVWHHFFFSTRAEIEKFTLGQNFTCKGALSWYKRILQRYCIFTLKFFWRLQLFGASSVLKKIFWTLCMCVYGFVLWFIDIYIFQTIHTYAYIISTYIFRRLLTGFLHLKAWLGSLNY